MLSSALVTHGYYNNCNYWSYFIKMSCNKEVKREGMPWRKIPSPSLLQKTTKGEIAHGKDSRVCRQKQMLTQNMQNVYWNIIKYFEISIYIK